jgi:hypothetical protein
MGLSVRLLAVLLNQQTFFFTSSVTFPGTQPAEDTLFDTYKHRSSGDEKKKQRIVAGETQKIEFVGKNYGADSNSDLACR